MNKITFNLLVGIVKSYTSGPRYGTMECSSHCSQVINSIGCILKLGQYLWKKII